MEIKRRIGKTLIEPLLYRVITLSVLYKRTVDRDPKVANRKWNVECLDGEVVIGM